MILTPLQKLTKNGEDWGKLIVAKAFKKLPKVQNIAQSGHTDSESTVGSVFTKNASSAVRSGVWGIFNLTDCCFIRVYNK